MTREEKGERLILVNRFIEIIASCGRKYFRYEDRIALIEMSTSGHLFMINEWNRKCIYISRNGPWRGFHHGGTLKALVQSLVIFIREGKQLPACCFNNHWAYGDDMQTVIDHGRILGVIATNAN